jgi:hypothetical protein
MYVAAQDFEMLKILEEVVRELYKKGGHSIFIDELNMEIKAVNDRGVWKLKFEPKE